jgi:DNA polymerase III sliding clamp (beta) subunit (PCNA family)
MAELELFDAPGANVAEIVTDGGTMKPFFSVLGRVDDAAKLHFSEDGISVSVTDPARVWAAEVTLSADAFDQYELHREAVVGVAIENAHSLIRRARKRHGDTLSLSVSEREMSATVSRGYDDHNVVSQGTVKLPDPKSIREPTDIPDTEYSVDMRIEADALTDALSYTASAADHIEMATKGVNQHTNALYIGGETDSRDESVAIDGVDTDERVSSLYSSDYISDVVNAITDASADSVQLRFAEEYPAEYTIKNPDRAMNVRLFIAPRVTND